MGHALHADKPNELIHFDFLFMEDYSVDTPCVLVLQDSASSFVWLEPCATADPETTATVLLKWICLFGVVLQWNSDKGSHFKNTLMRSINQSLHAHHHFTTPYCPQSNGTVESVCKEVLRSCRALLSELRMKETEWPSVLRLVQSTLKHSVRSGFGFPADNTLRSINPPGAPESRSIDFIHSQNIKNIEALGRCLEEMHRDVFEKGLGAEKRQWKGTMRKHRCDGQFRFRGLCPCGSTH